MTFIIKYFNNVLPIISSTFFVCFRKCYEIFINILIFFCACKIVHLLTYFFLTTEQKTIKNFMYKMYKNNLISILWFLCIRTYMLPLWKGGHLKEVNELNEKPLKTMKYWKCWYFYIFNIKSLIFKYFSNKIKTTLIYLLKNVMLCV